MTGAVASRRGRLRPLSRLPIRWRLTGWYAGLLAVAIVLFGVSITVGLRTSLYEEFDEQVEDQTALMLTTVQEGGSNLRLVQGDAGALEQDEHFVRLLAPDGEVLTDTSGEIEDLMLDPALVAAALAGKTSLTSVDGGDETFRVMTVPVTGNGAIRGVLQVGMSREEIDEAVRILVILLAITGPVVLAIAVGGGYLIAGRAMAPVATITRLAGSVEPGDQTTRLRLDLPDDELGQLATTFDVMLDRIGDSFEHQRRFTGDAAHELRTPLSLMRSRVELALLDADEDGRQTETLTGLQRDLDRLTSLVGNLLMLARADARELALSPERCDLAELIETTAETFAPSFAEANVTLRRNVLPVTLEADADLLVQVLVNLLSNALTHTPSGGTVEIGCDRQGDTVRCWVSDTGRGIAPEHQPRVFDRFYRVDPGRTRSGGGAGLGLSISRSIVQAHGGKITLSSTPGAGTRVEVELPVRPRDR